MRRPSPRGLAFGDRRELGLRRQRAEHAVEQLAGVVGVDVADDGDLERVAREHAPRIVVQVVGGDARHRSRACRCSAAVGMVRETRSPTSARLAMLVRDWWSRAAAPTASGRGCARPPRRRSAARSAPAAADRTPRRWCSLQRAQRAVEVVAADREAELDGVVLEPLVERLGVELAGAFVEQVGGHVGDAGLVGRVLAGAAAEGEIRARPAAPTARAPARPRCRRARPRARSWSRAAGCAAPAAAISAAASAMRQRRRRITSVSPRVAARP